uniref:Uncharacterized protein n=1 Tax=Glossina palpalis gambiensis TaxID=67801 RepID=A0A1B0BZZ8_9MUSC
MKRNSKEPHNRIFFLPNVFLVLVMTMIIIEKENTKTFAYVLQDITKLNIVEFRIAHKVG